MTISSLTNRNSYPGAGTTGPFTFNFRVFSTADLLVTKRSALNTETTLVYGTDFTLTTGVTVGDLTGSITLTVALAAGEMLSIRRAPPLTQPTSIQNQGAYFPKTHEDEFDRLAMQIQSLKDQADRSARLSESYDPAAMQMTLKPETGKVLAWQSGTQLGNSTLASSAVALPGEGRTVATLSAYLLNNRVFNVLDYGAAAAGAAGADQQPAIQAAIDAGGDNSYILIPPSAVGYRLLSPLIATHEDQIIDFQGAVLYVDHNGDGIRIGYTGGVTRRPKVFGGYIRHVSATNWVAGSRGIRIINCLWGEFHASVNGFYEGVSMLGDGFGCEMNKIYHDGLSNCLFGAKLYGTTGGYCSENAFHSGEIRYDGSVPNASTGYAIHIDRHASGDGTSNNNRFYGLTLQNARVGLEPKAIFLSGVQNHFHDLRGEGFAAPPIVLGADASLGPNYFHEMGPNFLGSSDIDFTLASNAPFIWTGYRGVEIRPDIAAQAALRLQHRGDAAGPVLDVLRRSDAVIVARWLTSGLLALGSDTPNRTGLSADNMVLTLEGMAAGKLSVIEVVGNNVGANAELARLTGMHNDSGNYRRIAEIKYRNGGANDAGIIDLQTQENNAGGLLTRLRLLAAGHPVLTELGSNPSAADLTSGSNAKDRLGFYMRNDKLVFAYNNAGTVTYVSIALDGSATTWVHSTSAP